MVTAIGEEDLVWLALFYGDFKVLFYVVLFDLIWPLKLNEYKLLLLLL
jgi:hypothetical protein